MDIGAVDHIEFYVGDAQQSAFYLCTAFGFRVCGQAGPETGQADRRSLLLRQGGIEIVLTSALTPEHPAAAYVARHGDGVANIAFEVTDATEAFALAVERGATAVEEPRTHAKDGTEVVTASVLGFGDVAHRFVQRTGDRSAFLPGVMDIIAEDPDEGAHLLNTVDHAAICLPAGQLRPTVAFYEKVFGFRQIFEEFIEVGEQAMDSKVVQSPSEKVTFTLIEPVTDRKPGQIDGFLGRHGGAGVQHLAFLADDIVAAVPALEARGVRFLETPGSLLRRAGGAHGPPGPQDRGPAAHQRPGRPDHWGQVCPDLHPVHARAPDLLLEVIDRHGALTFGSGNIKALYEAEAREKATA